MVRRERRTLHLFPLGVIPVVLVVLVHLVHLTMNFYFFHPKSSKLKNKNVKLQFKIKNCLIRVRSSS
jgi:hypothetical protein